MSKKIRLFKKHANRRLYDTELKKYVSLGHILDIINAGTDVKIEDTKTGEDISRPILLQIMADCEQRGRPMLSPAMLMTLIRHYGHPMQDFVGPFLEKSLGFYMRQEAALRRRMSDIVEEGAPGKITKAGRESFTAMRDNLMQILKAAKRN